MTNEIILGIIQGITEWLPISSSGMILLVESNFLGGIGSIAESIEFVLFLHLGTFFAALIYFREDVIKIFKTLFNYKKAKPEDKNILIFLIITTIISGIVGYFLLYSLSAIEDKIDVTSKSVNFFIGVMLLITAVSSLNSKKRGTEGNRTEKDLVVKDGLILGFMQSISPIPGISRSGVTVSGLLLRKFTDTVSLRLSFLMSLPIVAGGNIALALFKLEKFALDGGHLLALLFSFVFGILTIHILLILAKKVSFGYFALFFGILLILATLVPV